MGLLIQKFHARNLSYEHGHKTILLYTYKHVYCSIIGNYPNPSCFHPKKPVNNLNNPSIIKRELVNKPVK